MRNAPAKPWLKFFPQDWRADEKLRLCSLAARGLWIEMLALMHRSERYGQLLIGGIVPTNAQLAVQVGASPDEVAELIGELQSAGVFSRAASGAIYSRRMIRDGKKAEIARRNGKSGGNPNLSKETGNPESDKGEVKPPDKGGLKPQRPEARTVSNETGDGAKRELFDRGVHLLTAAGRSPSSARSFLGRQRKLFGDERVVAAVRAADEASPPLSDPTAWITARLKSEQREPELNGLLADVDRMRRQRSAQTEAA